MQINVDMASKMHQMLAMRAAITLCFFLALVAGNAIAEESAMGNPDQVRQMKEQAAKASEARLKAAEEKFTAAQRELDDAEAKKADQAIIDKLRGKRDAAKKERDDSLNQHVIDKMSLAQDQGRNQKLTSNESNSNGHQSKGGSSKGGMPPMPAPPSPPKNDSKEDSSAQESPKAETAQTPATPPKDLTPAADPKEEALSAELQKQLADLTAVNPNGTPKAENEPPETSTTLVAQKLATDTVKQSEEIAAKILTPAVEPPKKIAAAPIDSSTKSTSRVSQNRPPQGLAGAMAAQIPSAPTSTAANQTDSRVASIAPAQSQTTQRALRAASGETAQTPSEEEAASSAPAFDMASLLGSPAEAPQSQDFNQTALRSERLTRSVRQDPLVNPNAPILPSALRAVMEGNKLVTGTPANR